jgi:hypothetical protein
MVRIRIVKGPPGLSLTTMAPTESLERVAMSFACVASAAILVMRPDADLVAFGVVAMDFIQVS